MLRPPVITPLGWSDIRYGMVGIVRSAKTVLSGLVMGSIEENWYRYSIDTFAKLSLVSILRYTFENPHHKLHIRKFVTYFDIFQLSDFEFFRNFCVSSTFASFLLRFGLFH